MNDKDQQAAAQAETGLLLDRLADLQQVQCCDIRTLNHSTSQHYDPEFAPVKVKAYRPLDLTDAERNYISFLWHTSKIESRVRHTRLSYVAKWFRVRYADVDCSDKALWLAIEGAIQL